MHLLLKKGYIKRKTRGPTPIPSPSFPVKSSSGTALYFLISLSAKVAVEQKSKLAYYLFVSEKPMLALGVYKTSLVHKRMNRVFQLYVCSGESTIFAINLKKV